MERIRTSDRVALQLPSQFRAIHGRLGILEGSAMPLPSGVTIAQEFKGVEVPVFYTTRMPLAEPSELQMKTGIALGNERPGKDIWPQTQPCRTRCSDAG